jgi:hypothetical protein
MAGAAVAGVVLAALAVEPAWPAHLVTSLLWFGGFWRPLAVPCSLAIAGAALIANTLAPGATWQKARDARRALRRPILAALAIVVGGASFAYAAGLLVGGTAVRALVLLALQLALFPGAMAVATGLALAGAILAADARRQPFLDWLLALWRRRPRQVERAVGDAWPALAAAGAAAVVAAAVLPTAMQGWGRADPPDARQYNFYSSFFNYAISADRIEQRDGYELGLRGLTLPPGRSGSIVFRLDRTPDSLVILKANFYNRRFDGEGGPADVFTNALELSTDEGRTYRTVLADTSLGEVIGRSEVNLTPLLGDSRTYYLRFRATNTTSAEVTVLPSIVVSTVVDPLTLPDPLFPIVPYAAGTALVAGAIGRWWELERRAAALVAAAVASGGAVLAAAAFRVAGGDASATGPATGWLQGSDAPAVQSALLAARSTFAAAVALLALGWLVRRGRRAHGRDWPWGGHGVPWLVVATVLVALVAVDARWTHLMRVRHEFLLPDAQGYQAIAEAFPQKLARYEGQRSSGLLDALYNAGFDGKASVAAVFYAGGNNGREPLWPATLRLVFNVLGSSAFHTRLTSLLLGTLVAALTCVLGWRLVHPLVGLTAGLLVALHPPSIANDVSGLREPLVSALLLVLVGSLLAARTGKQPAPWPRLVAAGVAGGGLVLVRADMLVLAGLIITGVAAAQRWPWRRWLATVGLVAVLAGPMYVGYAFTHDDPFYPGTYGATVNRNLEFPDKMGTPGFPSPQAYAANWAAGPPISPMQYFFGAEFTAFRREYLHRVPEFFPGERLLPPFIAYSVRGFVRVFPSILFERQGVLLPLCVAGVALLLLARRWAVPFALVISLAPFYAFLAGVPNPWVFPGRYALHALPYAEMAVAFGMWGVPLWLAGRVASRWAQGQPAAVAGHDARAAVSAR